MLPVNKPHPELRELQVIIAVVNSVSIKGPRHLSLFEFKKVAKQITGDIRLLSRICRLSAAIKEYWSSTIRLDSLHFRITDLVLCIDRVLLSVMCVTSSFAVDLLWEVQAGGLSLNCFNLLLSFLFLKSFSKNFSGFRLRFLLLYF